MNAVTEIKFPELVDAQAMARKHPATIEVPNTANLATIGAGSLVKVNADRERSWVIVLDPCRNARWPMECASIPANSASFPATRITAAGTRT